MRCGAMTSMKTEGLSMDALLLAASGAVDLTKADKEAHLNSAIAAGAYVLGVHITPEQAQEALLKMKKIVRRMM